MVTRMAQHPHPSIGDEQVAFYRRNGYLVVPNVLDEAEIASLRAASDEMVERSRHLTENDEDYEFEPGHSATSVRVRRLRRPFKSDRRFRDISRSDKIMDIVAKLIGPEIRLSHPSGKVNMKGAEGGAAVEWHQDWTGYPHTNEDLLTVGVPLDDVEMENGPLLVIPGSHKGPVYSHHTDDGKYVAGINPERCDIDFSKAVPLTTKSGGITLHHVRLVHGSAANTSTRQRRLFLIQCAAVDAWPLLGVPDIDAYNAAIVRGTPTLRPRMEKLPVLVPGVSGIPVQVLYDAQTQMQGQYFAAAGAGGANAG
ncbi:MAG TPA: phytanoyl-CoA dioxygenase family protein [Candidatus Elarobacter sp.]|jgi:ectoine hydroxylase-related dioxygenase (phytanoyl-CoA dioxygenase family)|nr:phytanoyl-CoA dioxygenase family protein [Candidatus Elarobacter sp.]